MKFRIITNANFDWRKRKKPKSPKTQKSIPDKDLCAQKGQSYDQALQAEIEYHYEGRPYGATEPHV